MIRTRCNVALNTLCRSHHDRKLRDGGEQCILDIQDSVVTTTECRQATTTFPALGQAGN